MEGLYKAGDLNRKENIGITRRSEVLSNKDLRVNREKIYNKAIGYNSRNERAYLEFNEKVINEICKRKDFADEQKDFAVGRSYVNYVQEIGYCEEALEKIKDYSNLGSGGRDGRKCNIKDMLNSNKVLSEVVQEVLDIDRANLENVYHYEDDAESPPEIYEYLSNVMRMEGMINREDLPNKRKDFIDIICDRNISVDKLRSIRNALYEDYISSVTRPNDGEFASQWCRFINYQICKRYFDEINEEVRSRPEGETAVRTMAVIEINNKYHGKTLIRKPFSGKAKDYFQYPEELSQQLAASNKDAELTTLLDAKILLRDVLPDGPYDSVAVNIMGTVGPCDGCHYRIQKFVKEFKDTGLCENLTVNAYYLMAPHETDTFKVKMNYGREKEAMKVILPEGRFYIEDYSLLHRSGE